MIGDPLNHSLFFGENFWLLVYIRLRQMVNVGVLLYLLAMLARCMHESCQLSWLEGYPLWCVLLTRTG